MTQRSIIIIIHQITVKELEGKIKGMEKEREEMSSSYSQDFAAQLEKEKSRHNSELAEQVLTHHKNLILSLST